MVRRMVMAPLAALLLILSSCSDPYGASEKAAVDIAGGITAGMKTVDALRVAGLISVQEETNILGYLKFANDANGAFGNCAQQAHNAGSKGGAYTACAQAFQTTLANPAELALIKVTNANAQAQVQVIADGIVTGISTLVASLGGK